jgi:hypothetical protein
MPPKPRESAFEIRSSRDQGSNNGEVMKQLAWPTPPSSTVPWAENKAPT